MSERKTQKKIMEKYINRTFRSSTPEMKTGKVIMLENEKGVVWDV